MIHAMKALEQRTIRRKFAAVFGWLALIALLQVAAAIAIPRMIIDRENRIGGQLEPVIIASQQVRRNVLEMTAGVAQWGLSGNVQDLALYNEGSANFARDIDALSRLGAANPDFNDRIKAVISSAQAISSTLATAAARTGGSKVALQQFVMRFFAVERSQLRRLLAELGTLIAQVESSRVAATEQSEMLQSLLVLVLVILTGSALLVAYLAARGTIESVVSAASTLSNAARLIAAGDFTGRVDLQTRDELESLAGAINSMIERLGTSLHKVQEVVNEASVAVMQIATSAMEQERLATQQSVALTEIAQTIQELNAASQNMATQAETISLKSQESTEVARRSQSDVETNVSMMLALRDRIRQTSERIAHLSEQLQQIGTITRTVADFAAQTNLLALNAAVEAARAGEQGRGFAVVASEIRKLADQSKTAADRIGALTRDIQRASDDSVMAMIEGSRNVDENATHAASLGTAISDLIETLQQTVDSMQDIALTAKQHSDSVDQLTHAITSINSTMREAVAATNQTNEATQRLNELALGLKSLVAAYRI